MMRRVKILVLTLFCLACLAGWSGKGAFASLFDGTNPPHAVDISGKGISAALISVRAVMIKWRRPSGPF